MQAVSCWGYAWMVTIFWHTRALKKLVTPFLSGCKFGPPAVYCVHPSARPHSTVAYAQLWRLSLGQRAAPVFNLQIYTHKKLPEDDCKLPRLSCASSAAEHRCETGHAVQTSPPPSSEYGKPGTKACWVRCCPWLYLPTASKHKAQDPLAPLNLPQD